MLLDVNAGIQFGIWSTSTLSLLSQQYVLAGILSIIYMLDVFVFLRISAGVYFAQTGSV